MFYPRVLPRRPALASRVLSTCVKSPASDDSTTFAHRQKPKKSGGGVRGLFVLLFCTLMCAFSTSASATTAMQTYVEAMQPGWNLGNTLDATPNETAWGNAPTTQEMIQQIKAQGFKSIRIPVTWDTGSRVGPAPDYTIDPAWLDRVQQIVDWSLAEGLYVMLNMHHDSGWVSTMPTNHDAVLAKFNAIWSQIAPRFRDHSAKLHFESINEPEFAGVDDATKNALLKELNVSFFNIVRATGGGNATRPLVLPSVVTNNGQVFLDALYDTITELNDPNLIATVHEYGFWPFSVNITGVTEFEGVAQEWTTAGIDRVHDTLVSKGIPVIVGEIGLLSFGGFNGAIERGEILQFFEYTLSYYRSKGMTYQWWDAGGFFNRSTFQWNVPEVYAHMIHSAIGRSSTAESDLVFLRSGTPVQDTVVQLNLHGNTFVSLTNGGSPLTPGVDYTLAGDILTLKAGFLAPYASGDYGVKTVLEANFSSGVPWKLFVRHQAPPALSAASSTKAGALVIPASFNGDVLATMEAHYVAAPGYPYPGPANWTAFKLYGDVYQPNYADNTITIKKEFFAETTNEAVDLTFHFWSGKKVNYRLTFQPGGGVIADPQELTIYDNQFYDGWGNWSWTPTNENSEEVVYSPTKSIAIDANPWAGTMFGNWMLPLNRADYRTLTVWANGGAVGGQRLTVSAVYNWAGTGSSVTLDPLPANTWTKLEIPLASLGVTDSSFITGLVFSNNSGTTLPRYYLDEVRLTTAYPSWIVFVNGAPAPVITSSTIAGGVFNSPFNYAVTAINGPATFSATGLPPGLSIDATTGVISGTPTAAGSYLVEVIATNAAGTGSQTVAITVAAAPLVITLPNGSSPVTAAYDGAPIEVSVTTSPAGVPVTVTYNGSTTAPTLPGTYQVVATSSDPNYTGSVTGTLVITSTALVRHAPVINGDIDGSLQLLGGESFSVSGSGSVSDDLLVPGTPSVSLNGNPLLVGVVDAGGAATPTNYSVTLNGGAVVRYVVRRVDPIAMPVVTAPPSPAGTRNVAINSTSQSIGDFGTLRNLTLSGNAGMRAIPAGTYGSFTLNGSGGIILGVAGATEPSVYNLQSLSINTLPGGSAKLQVVGPVIVTLAGSTILNASTGSAEHPEWLTLRIASGGMTISGNGAFHGSVIAPNGTITLNGNATLNGTVASDRLTLNGTSLLSDPSL